MRNLIKLIAIVLLPMVFSCRKEKTITYQINEFNLIESRASKFKSKNEAEYISILYTNLIQEAISPVQLNHSQNVLYSIGDQSLAKEMLLSNYFNTSKIMMPTDQSMHSNPDEFIKQTYRRFYLRIPSQSELYFFRNYIKNHPDLKVEMVYTAFASSEEYNFY